MPASQQKFDVMATKWAANVVWINTLPVCVSLRTVPGRLSLADPLIRQRVESGQGRRKAEKEAALGRLDWIRGFRVLDCQPAAIRFNAITGSHGLVVRDKLQEALFRGELDLLHR